MSRYCIADSSWFDMNEYNINQLKQIVKSNGGTNVRTRRKWDWSNQPEVVTFNTDDPEQIETAVNIALKTIWVRVEDINEW